MRTPSTLSAIDALVACELLATDDAARLRDAYALCERARNYRYLLTGASGDSLPTDGDEAAKLARMLGYVHRPQQTLREEYRRVTRRGPRGRRARLLWPRGLRPLMTWDGDDYQRRFDALAASGMDVHGEADFVMRFAPATVLDAGCGTGRVAVELARRGSTVVGVDTDPSMLATARARGSDVEWLLADLTDFDLGRSFDVVVMAGNVPLFTPAGTQAALVAGCARHVAGRGVFVAGFQLAAATRSWTTTRTAARPGSSSPTATRPGTGTSSPTRPAMRSPCTARVGRTRPDSNHPNPNRADKARR